MEKFISKNKMMIKLPVPLGTEVFIVMTNCSDACLFEKDKFNKLFPPTNEGRCSRTMPCHTKALPPKKIVLSIDNLNILKEWKTRIFLTEKEAKEKTIEIINSNIKFLKENGFNIKDDGTFESKIKGE